MLNLPLELSKQFLNEEYVYNYECWLYVVNKVLPVNCFQRNNSAIYVNGRP